MRPITFLVMKSPAEQKIIQIDVTNACTHQCSNCTRFCGHHRKPFFMDVDTFGRALASLTGFPGMIGIMGGEPTLHPEFESLVALVQKYGGDTRSTKARKPIRDFAEYRDVELTDLSRRFGLWTSLGDRYYRHYEIIQDTFSYQCINDHANPGLHQALLVARKDLNISDNEWFPLRDRCWIQNLWSSAITPKGAFFCEVAAALDMLFDGPGGWPLGEDWWKRTPADFGDQLQWCELCGAALQTPRCRANEEMDVVSPSLMEKLKAVYSPKARQGRVQVLNVSDYQPDDGDCKPSNEWYLPDEDNAQRVTGTNRTLYPRQIDAIIVGRSAASLDVLGLSAAAQFDRVVLAKASAPQASASETAANTTVCYMPGATREGLLRKALTMLKPLDWVVVLDEDAVLEQEFCAQLRGWILNPGCVYEFNRRESWAECGQALMHTADSRNELRGTAFCSVFNVRARSLRGRMPEAFAFDLWPADKRIDMRAFLINPDPLAERRRQGEAMARHALSVWQILADCRCRVALFGAGHHTRWLLRLLKTKNLPSPVVVFDDNPYAARIEDVDVVQPQNTEPFDFNTVVVSADPGRMTQILTNRCRKIWGAAKNIVELYREYPEDRFMKVMI